MNQVHKVIWSRVKNCYIVVSEITKRVGRDNKASVTGIRPLRALLCAMVIAGCMLPADADAAPGLIHAGTGATASGDSSIAYGYSAQAKKDHSIAQGTGADAEEEYALAMGYKAIAKGLQSLAIGRQANAIGNNSIAAGAGAKGYAQDGVAIGNNAESGTADNKDPRIPTILSKNGVAVGNSAKASGGSSVSVGNDSIGNGPSSVAIGNAATANDVRTTAIGNNAHAEGAGSLSIGREASALTLENATSTNPLVTGDDEKLDKKGVMAIGDDAKASGNNSIALGTSAKAGDLEKTRNEDSVSLTGDVKRITKLTSTRSVNNAVAIGTESSVQSDEDIAVGYRAATVKSKYHQLPGSGQVAIGSNSNTYGTRGDVAIGSGAETNIRVKNVDHTTGTVEKPDGQSVAIGSVAKAYGSQAVAVGADTRAIGNSSVAIGTDDIQLDRTGLQSLLPGLANNENLNNKAPNDATLGSAALGDKPYYVKTASIGTASVAIGAMSQAAGDASMAMGLNALAEGDASTAIGPLARSKGKNSIAMGRTALAKEEGAVAVGNESLADGTSGTALGNKAKAKKNYDIAVGYNAAAEGNPTAPGLTDGSALSIGTNANAKGTNAVSIGNNAQATNKSTVAVGGTASGDSATSLGYVTTASGTSSVALGYYAQAAGSYGTAVGGSAKAKGESSIAVGAGAEAAGGKGNTAIGHKAKVESTAGDGNIAFGSSASVKDGAGHVVIGKNASANTVNGYGIAIGSSASIGIGAAADAAAIGTGSRVEGSGIAFGRQAQVTASSTESGIAIGTESSVDGAQKGTAIGYKAKVLSSGDDSGLAIGTESSAGGNEGSIALGKKASVDSSTNAGGVAIGLNASAKGISSIVIGKDAKADDGNQAHVIAIGVGATATGTSQYSSVMGSAAKASREYSTVLGSNANSEVDGGVALGANSISNRHAGGSATGDVRTTNPYIPAGAGAAQVNAINATKGTTGAVSVGSDTVKRQIINVAAGTDDSDAVNVAQLKAAAANAAGSVSWTVQENYSDVNEVKNGSKVNFADGTNTTASVTKDASGKVTAVKYNLKKDVDLGSNGSLTIGNVKINNTGINAGNKQITNVASGGDTITNAANIGDINRIVEAKDKYVTGGTANYQTNGDGTAALTGTNNLTANITGLKNNYVTTGSVSNDGKTLTLERNDTGKVNVDLSKIFTEVAKEDYHLVANPEAGSQGKYKADSSGNMVLTVANDKGDKKQVTLTDIASKAQQNTNTTNITNINNTIEKGLNFGGDSGADINKKLGEKLEIKGGASADLTDGNIGVVSDGAKLNVKLKKDVNLGADGSLTINGKTYINKNGLNANNQKITNVEKGTAGTDAVNVDQLNAAIAGTAKATTVKAKDANVTVTEGLSTETGGKEYTVGLGDKVTLGTADKKIVVDGTSGKITAGSKVTIDGTTGDIQAGTVKVTGAGTVNELTNRTWDIDNPTIVHGQAATEDQLKTVSDGVKTNKTDITNINTTIGKGLNFKGDDATVINKKLGEQLDIKGGADASKLSDGNIGVVSGNGALNVKLAKDVKVDSVTTGGTVINNNGLTVGGKTYVTNNGLNVNGQKVTNVATGTAGTDAVNVDQLNAAIAGTAKATTVKAKDANVTVTEGLSTETGGKEYTVGLGDKVTLGTADKKIVVDGTSGKITAGSKVTIDGTTGDIQAGTVKVTGAGTVNELTNRTWDIDNPTIVHGQAATEDQLKTVSDGVKTNKTNITNINNTIGKGLNFGGDSGAVINKKLGEKLEIKGGASADLTDDNIGVVSDGTKLNVKLKKDVNLGPDGSLTINGKTYVNKDGLNANGQKITNVADGTVNSDAVNFGQLKDAVAAGKTILKDGKNTTVEGEGTVANPYKVNVNDDLVLGRKGADGKDGSIGVNGKDGSAVVINGKDGSIGLNGKDGANGLTIKGGDGKPGVDGTNITRLIIEEKNGKKHDVATLDDGLKFAGNTGIVAKKLNETMTIKGTGVKADTEYDASNIKTMVNSNGEMIVGLDKNLKADSVGINGKDGRDGATIKGGDGKPGVDGTNITRLIIEEKNGKQHDIATLDDGMKYGGDTGAVIKKKLNGQVNVVGGIGDEGKLTTDDNIGVVSDGRNNLKVRLAKDLKGLNSVTTGNTVMNNDGLTIKNGPKIVAAGIDAGGKKITNVAAGEADTDAVNFSQLKNQGSEIVNKGFGIKAEDGNEVKKKLGETVDVVGDGKNISTRVEGGRVKVGLKDDILLNSVTTGRTRMDTNGFTVQDGSGNTAVTVDKDGLKIKDGPSVTKSGIDAGGKKITNVAAGEADTDAVNFSQLKKAAAGATTKVADGKNTTVTSEDNADGSKTYHVNLNDDITLGTDSSKQISIKGSEGTIKAGQVTVNGTAGTVNGLTNKTWDPNHITSGQAATEDQLKVVSGQAGKHSSVTAGSNISVTTGTNANGGTEYKVAVVDTPTFKTVTTGNTVMSNNGLTIKNGPSITQTGVDAGGKRITNVAAGKADTDAVNVGQLKQIGGAINKVDNRINRVGAGAAALAALHPLDFDPDDKWDFTLGYGNYKDAHSLALGAFYRPNEDTMISVGGSIGGGENMVNAGLSMKLGQGNHVSTSKVAMAKEIKDLRAELENVKGALLKVADGRPLDSMDMDKMQLFPDVPENHWAYDYVATLAGNGVIVGYPDGQFGGDRMMTRYEMAALIYRAMQNGAAADDRMARALKEFEPELERIRVDTISKHKDGTPDIQRVRVIKGRG
ncbi:S-layer homology domain-containing protein [Dialister invisus]|uniref:S-layer homology domain-containing protein n=1 Tax=Dialister invisus TaxID=218538 RepID=UPI0039F59C66